VSWTTACHWRLHMPRSWGARTMTPPLAFCAAQCIQPASCLMLWRSWVWNGLPQRNRPVAAWMNGPCRGRHKAPRQGASPFFPEVHDEITKSWHAPYSSRLRASSSSSLTSVDGTEEKGYNSLPPLDESVAAHLCLSMAIGWKAKAAHLSKPCRITSALAG